MGHTTLMAGSEVEFGGNLVDLRVTIVESCDFLFGLSAQTNAFFDTFFMVGRRAFCISERPRCEGIELYIDSAESFFFRHDQDVPGGLADKHALKPQESLPRHAARRFSRAKVYERR